MLLYLVGLCRGDPSYCERVLSKFPGVAAGLEFPCGQDIKGLEYILFVSYGVWNLVGALDA